MLLDIADLESGSELEADLCIVGGGPAGISLALELGRSPLQVVLLESGGRELDGATQRLYSGAVRGTILDDRAGYLTTSRLRLLGGSSLYWQGWCRPHDAIDFEERAWVADSGWPIDRTALAGPYDRAAALCGVPPFDDEAERARSRALLLRGDADFETTFFHVSEPVRFGAAYGGRLAAASRLRAVTHANVVRLVADESGRTVRRVEAVALDGRRLAVRSRGVVLACGGIENARLLLASGGAEGRGFGNDRDLVGRFFAEHPLVDLGVVALPYWRWLMRTYGSLDFGGERRTARGVLRPGDAMQRRERLVNALFVFDLLTVSATSDLAPEISALATDVLQLAEGHPDPERGSSFFGRLEAAVEQPPERDNRVTLGEERDALGMRRAELHWRIGEQAERSLEISVEALVRKLGARLRGRARILAEGEDLWSRARPSNHHMGTTRMASSPDRGVVDADCRVHGMENLWIAGSSVFPTSGCSNPTLTLVALAVRLADHLSERLAS